MICALALTGCADPKAVKTAEFSGSEVEGYLKPEMLPGSFVLLPPPPAEQSPAILLDQAYSQKSLSLRGTPAWDLAILDADLEFPNAAGTYSCALDAPINQQDTPHLYTLLRRTLKDAGASTGAAKKHYQRPRPFMLNQEAICTPDWKSKLEKSGSYPSGHNAAGTAWALILTEIAPNKTDAILARGQAFGMSRVVCNVHWYSDTLQGRYLGAYTVARLHADSEFRTDMEAAKVEFNAARAKGLKPARDCGAEKAGMDLQNQLNH